MMKEETTYHIPVLLMPSVDAMNIRPDGTYVDVTFGGGGHSREILSRLEDGGRLLSFDQDEDAERNIVNNPHFTFVRSNFRYLHNFLRYHGIEKVDAILADLGVSSHHFDDSERGFSFRFDGALDMRMNKRAGLTAADIVNTYEEEKLADIFYLYGELKNSRKLASVIVKARATQRIATIGEFLEIVKPLFGREREKKELAKVFQALRIEVNQEMEALKEMLYAATEALKPGGRLVVITYHSLEDRMVKNIMKTGNVEGKAEKDFFGNVLTPFRLVNNKVIVPDEEEIERNPRSRSAKLRIAERVMNDYLAIFENDKGETIEMTSNGKEARRKEYGKGEKTHLTEEHYRRRHSGHRLLPPPSRIVVPYHGAYHYLHQQPLRMPTATDRDRQS